MAFIGNTNTTQAFTPAIDYFSGNGSTTAFTLTRPVASVAQVQVVVNNVAQNPSSAFSVSGSTITFTSAPSAGTSNIYVYYTSPITQIIAPGQNTVNSSSLANGAATKIFLDAASSTGAGALGFPTGTTAQRPSAPLVGDTRWNSTLQQLECWTGSGWGAVITNSYTVTYLAVAGGGGSASYGGGGGAGGYLAGTSTVTGSTAYTITVGGGGPGATAASGLSGTAGTNSVFTGVVTAIGGGGGGCVNGTLPSSGGSGGGAGGASTAVYSGAAGTSGQGFAGGSNGSTASPFPAGGGGGAGAVGASGGGSVGGAGGVGLSNPISGSTVFYAGGGGGSTGGAGTGGAGGNGGGGAGSGSGAGTAGTANTGGGAGGSNNVNNGPAGGSGVVIISYAGAQRGTGGTVTSSGGNTIHTFTTSGTFTA